MKRTMRGVLTTLTASLALAVTTWLTPANALPSIPNLLNSGGGGTLKLADVIYPSDYTLQRSLNTSTGLSDVIVRWKDTSPADTSTLIERANSAGTWSTLTTIAKALDGPQSYVDRNLPADSEWCYRIRIRGANNAEVLTLPRCVVTQKLNDIGVFRAQLRIRVANVSNGGTDGRVAVALQAGPFNIPTGSYTGLKTAIDDLEAGSDVTYDLIQDGITTLRDITRIGVYTGSTDAFCVSQIQLIVNTAVAFERTWGNSAATCEWVDGYNAIYVSHDELRASPQFVNFQSPIMSPLVETDELESRLEAVIGTLIFERLDVDWRNPGVVVVAADRQHDPRQGLPREYGLRRPRHRPAARRAGGLHPERHRLGPELRARELPGQRGLRLVGGSTGGAHRSGVRAGRGHRRRGLRGLHVAAREAHRPGDQEGLRHPLQAHPGGATGQLRDAGGHRAERWRALLLLRAGADHPHQGHDRAEGPRAGRAADSLTLRPPSRASAGCAARAGSARGGPSS